MKTRAWMKMALAFVFPFANLTPFPVTVSTSPGDSAKKSDAGAATFALVMSIMLFVYLSVRFKIPFHRVQEIEKVVERDLLQKPVPVVLPERVVNVLDVRCRAVIDVDELLVWFRVRPGVAQIDEIAEIPRRVDEHVIHQFLEGIPQVV